MSGLSILSGVTIIDEVPTGGTTGQVLTKKSNSDFDLEWTSVAGTGSVTSVSAGVGLTATPNPITGAGQIDLANGWVRLADGALRRG